MSFTDMRRQKWIEHLPQEIRPYMYLMRLDRPIGWWLLLLPSWWAIVMAEPEINGKTVFLLGLFWVGAVVMRGAGCVINDLWDRDLDKKVERTASRPIASGEIDEEDAFIFLSILLLTGFAILCLMPLTTIILGILSIPLIITYPLMKRITWWPQAFLGLTFNFGALMGWSAVSGNLSIAALFLYAACFLWTIGYDTIYALQDKEDDVKVGIKSTALLFGKRSRDYVFAFYAAAAVLFVVALFNAPVGWLSFILVLMTFSYAGYRLSMWDPSSQESSLQMFKHNREIGLLIFLSLAL